MRRTLALTLTALALTGSSLALAGPASAGIRLDRPPAVVAHPAGIKWV